MIKFRCSHCNHKMGAPDEYANKKRLCPKCKKPIIIPQESQQSDAAASSIIKFRCPGCNQKIGVTKDYAGKRVKCSKCKTPLQVPAAVPESSELTSTAFIGDDNAGADNLFADQLTQELSAVEAAAPEIETLRLKPEPSSQTVEAQGNGGHANGERDSAVSSASHRSEATTSTKAKPMIIAGICVAAIIVIVVVIGLLVPDAETGAGESAEPSQKAGVDYSIAEEFSLAYLGLFKYGQAELAKGFFSSRLAENVTDRQLEKLEDAIGDIAIERLDCSSRSSMQIPEGEFYVLLYSYNSGNYDEYESITVALLEVDKEFIVESTSVQSRSDGTSVFINVTSDFSKKLQSEIMITEIKEVVVPIAKFFGIIIVIIIIVSVFTTISMCFVYHKAGQPAWAPIVPVYNMWVLAEIGDKPGWWGLTVVFGGAIPIVGNLVSLVVLFMISIGVANAFGRGVLFGIGLCLLPFIFYPILAFSGAGR